MAEKLKQDHYKVTPKKQENVLPTPREGQKDDREGPQYLAGRGAQFNTKNRFLKDERTREHIEGIDDWSEENAGWLELKQRNCRPDQDSNRNK